MRSLLAIGSGLSLLLLATGCPRMPDQADVRVVHASPDAPAVDVCAAGAVLFEGAEFPGATAYARVDAGAYDVKVIPSGAGCDTAGVIEAIGTGVVSGYVTVGLPAAAPQPARRTAIATSRAAAVSRAAT